MVLAEIPDVEVVGKLFSTLAPRFAERPGGYTRILRVGFRRGDGAEVAQVELVGSEWVAPAETPEDGGGEEAPKKTKGVGERLKQVARRIRGAGGAGRRRRPAGRRRAGAADVDPAESRRIVGSEAPGSKSRQSEQRPGSVADRALSTAS